MVFSIFNFVPTVQSDTDFQSLSFSQSWTYFCDISHDSLLLSHIQGHTTSYPVELISDKLKKEMAKDYLLFHYKGKLHFVSLGIILCVTIRFGLRSSATDLEPPAVCYDITIEILTLGKKSLFIDNMSSYVNSIIADFFEKI